MEFSILKKVILLICFLFASTYFLNAQVTVVKRATEVNPNLYFSEIIGDSSFSGYMLSSLKNCGWFTIIPSPRKAKYKISGKIDKNKVQICAVGASSFTISMEIDTNNSRHSAQQLVDALMHKIFNIPGICTSKIAFVAQSGEIKEIYECDYDGENTNKLTNNKSLSLEPNWGGRDKFLVYTLYTGNYIDIVGLKLSDRKTYNLSSFPGLNMGGTISPSGKYLAVVLSRDKQVELYVKKIYGKGLKRLTYDEAVEGSPCWSPNGVQICFVSDKYLRVPKLYIVDVNSSKAYKISTIGSEAVNPDWSPDGNKIIYSARIGKQYVLAIYDIKTKKSSTVKINDMGNWMSPSWARDGRHVVCSRVINYHSQLYIVDTWTGKSKKLLKSKMNLSSPSWSGLM